MKYSWWRQGRKAACVRRTSVRLSAAPRQPVVRQLLCRHYLPRSPHGFPEAILARLARLEPHMMATTSIEDYLEYAKNLRQTPGEQV